VTVSYLIRLCSAGQKHTSGFAPLVGVPAMLSPALHQLRCAGTPYPLRSRGSEFNELAPHTPERLDAPRLAARRQRRGARAPPTLKSMARHGSLCYAPPKTNRKRVFRQ